MQLHKILGDIRKADQDYNLIQNNDTIAVGVSGGKDSMVLLTALHIYSKFPDKNFKVIGIHIKLGFPDMDFSEIENFCKQQGIELHIVESKIYNILKLHPGNDGKIQCSLCSRMRKSSVNNAAKQFHCNKVAFGHHSDDAVETLLMNGIFGGKLATFLPKMYLSKDELTFIRPMIYSYESDVLNAQVNNNIPFVVSTCPNDGYTKRQEMKELLDAFYEKYPMAKGNFQRMLYNEEQIELWHRENDHNKIKAAAKKPRLLLEQDGYNLIQKGQTAFIDLHSKKNNIRVSDMEMQQLLNHQITIKEIIEQHKKKQ